MADYTFDGSEGKPVDLSTAKTWTANYRASLPDPKNDTLAHFFGFAIIQKILAEPGCMGLRIYYGIDDNGKKQLMLVGADAQGDNLLPNATAQILQDENTIADFSYPCPSACPGNPL